MVGMEGEGMRDWKRRWWVDGYMGLLCLLCLRVYVVEQWMACSSLFYCWETRDLT